jgi:hypothetical protein
MDTKSSKGKEIKIPGTDHPITISPAGGSVRVTVAGRIVAESTRALRLEEKGYPPVYARSDNALHLLPVQGRLRVLQHSHWRSEIGICRLDL